MFPSNAPLPVSVRLVHGAPVARAALLANKERARARVRMRASSRKAELPCSSCIMSSGERMLAITSADSNSEMALPPPSSSPPATFCTPASTDAACSTTRDGRWG